MRMNRKLSNPLIALIGITLLWVVLVVCWVYWFIGKSTAFSELALRYKPELVSQGVEWLVLVEGILMLVGVLAGVYVMFLYWRRQAKLYLQQRSYISQLTHELKSPLASLHLHLETIKMRDVPREKLTAFVDTMLSDTERLNNLTSNLLMATRIEFGHLRDRAAVIDFSSFVKEYVERNAGAMPEGGRISAEVEDGIQAAIDAEAMEMALRNLLENALLYSPVSPEIQVTLKKSGRQCILDFKDNGKGLRKSELKRVFRMFYRVRHPGESIRGTGLGLYIVKSVINAHRGKVSVESDGPGKGCTFHLVLPLAGAGQKRGQLP